MSVAVQLRGTLSSVDELLSLLSPVLGAFSLLDDRADLSASASSDALPSSATLLKRQLGLIQATLVTHVWLTWSPALDAALPAIVFRRLFIPPQHSPFARQIALEAYSTLLVLLSTSAKGQDKARGPLSHAPTLQLVAQLLADLATEYPLNELAKGVFRDAKGEEELQRWTLLLRDLAAIPAKVANAAGLFLPLRPDIPHELIWTFVSPSAISLL